MSLQTITDVEIALRPYVPLVAQLTGKDTTLARIKPLMSVIGNPEARLKVVHIAGTSGKTSTAYYMAALLQAAGQRVGLTVSPHVDSVTERVQIDGQPLSNREFCNELELFLELVRQAPEPPSYFELLYAFALWVFDRQNVDYAVVETGLGGLFDATNVITRPDKLCVITDIGYDHMHVLGSTLPQIAAQKIGIVHEQNQVFCYDQALEIMEVFDKWCNEHAATLHPTNAETQRAKYASLIDVLPLFQQRNWLLAYTVFMYMQNKQNWPELTQGQLLQTQRLQVPARMEIISRSNKTIVMDGAHNQQKMAAFINSFKALYPTVQPAILVALKTDKAQETVSPLLADLAGQIIVTNFDTSQDLPARSMDPELFANTLRSAGAKNVQVVPDQRAAYDTLMKNSAKVCIITGSFYLLSQLRAESII